jgi:DnaJ family protein C protein 2
MLRGAMVLCLVLLSSIATHLFVGVETAPPGQPDTCYYTGELFPRPARRADAEDAAQTGPLLLLPPAEGGGPEVFRSNAPVHPSRCEEAGLSHHRLLRLRAGVEDPHLRSRSQSVNGRTTAARADDPAAESPEEAARKDVSAGMQDDHYGILGLGDVRWRATEDQIKRAYHRTSLRCHPDKVCGKGEDERRAADEHYKKVNKAYAVLSDKQKRVGYDSLDTSTDMLPTAEEVQEGGFFPVMSYYFEVNARWSIDKRIPSLGDENTPISAVESFYHFWESFKSWRDFRWSPLC